MARETSVTRKTLEKNLRTGLWVLIGDYDSSKFLYYVTVTTAKKTLGAGRTMMVSIHETPGETKAREEQRQNAALRRIELVNKLAEVRKHAGTSELADRTIEELERQLEIARKS